MRNFYKYQRFLKRTEFDNFVLDESNRSAYETFVNLALQWNKDNNKILLTGPKRSGKTHLIISLLDTILKSYPKAEIERINGMDFLGHVIWEYQRGGRDNLDNYINRLIKNDILVIEEINYIDGQLKGHALTKSALFSLLNKWNSTDKLLIFTIDESSENRIVDNEIIELLKGFHVVTICRQRSELINTWLEKAVSISQVPIDLQIRKNIIAESDSISRARSKLLDHYSDNYKEFFDMETFELPINEILDYTLGERIGYKSILDFSKLQTSEYTRKQTIYFLSKFASLDIGSISKKLKLNESQTQIDLLEVEKLMENNDFARDLWRCSERLLLGLYGEE